MAEDKKRIGILAECVCDLPIDMMKKLNIDILYFQVETETGIFTDNDEITSENAIAYMEEGGRKIKSMSPAPEVYLEVFQKNLKLYDEIILVTISSEISHSFENATMVARELGEEEKRIHVFDSRHLSTGIGFLVLRAAELAGGESTSADILKELEDLRERVSTSFLTRSTDYLHRKGLVSTPVNKICQILNIHPVITMKKGHIRISGVFWGNYDSAGKYYVKKIIRNKSNIDKKCCFITHVGCSINKLKTIKEEVQRQCAFEEIKVTNASATISSNCGPGTFGVLYIRKK